MGLALAALLALGACAQEADEPQPPAETVTRPANTEVLLATTTSVQDSGLLDALLPDFTRETGITVRVVAVGTGAALRMGEEGNADLLLTHAPPAEMKLLSSASVSSRTAFMENHFVIAGPKEDPAGVGRTTNALDAFRKIHGTRSPFVSRGDKSGTHKKEYSLLMRAGLDPQGGWDGYVSTGAGMGHSLQVAGTKRAYVLSDLGTFLAFRERVDLEALSKPERELRNEYALMPVSGTKFGDRIRTDTAQALIDYLVRADVQRRIGEFGHEKFGRSLFKPILLDAAADAS